MRQYILQDELICALIALGAPVVEISPQNQNAVRYNNVSFVCTAIGYPRPVIEWLKDDAVLTNITTDKLLIINFDIGDCLTTECGLNSTLWIFSATVDDMGRYTCSGSNFAGTDRRTAQLVIAATIGNVNTIYIA